MVIKTELTAPDFRVFTRHVAFGKSGLKGVYVTLLGTGAIVGAILGVTLAVTGIHLDLPNFIIGLFAGTFTLVIYAKLQMRNTRPAAEGSVLGPRTISISEVGVGEACPHQETLIRWPAVRAVQSVGEHTFIMIDRNAGIIIPHRAFTSDEERKQFLAELRQHAPAAVPSVL